MATKNNLTAKLPVAIHADEYHEFQSILDFLEKVGIRGITYHEIPEGCYEAVFYTGTFKGSEAEKLFKQIQRECLEGDE